MEVEQKLDAGNQQIQDQNKHGQWAIAQLGSDQAWKMKELLSKPADMSAGAIGAQTAGMPALPQFRAGATPGAQPTSMMQSGFAGAVNNNLGQMQEAANAPVSAAPETRQFDARYTSADATRTATERTTSPDQVQSRYLMAPERVATRQIGENAALEDQLYKAAFARYQPQLDQQEQDRETDLANKGLRAGSTGYGKEMQRFDNSVNDLRSTTFLQGQEQAFGQSKARAENDFGQDMASNNQFFNQSDRKQNSDFAMDLSGQAQKFGQDLAANGQNFQQELGANNQNFNQQLSANGQNFGMDATRSKQLFEQDMAGAQLGDQRVNDRFSRLAGATTAQLGAQGQDYTQRMEAQQNEFNQDMTQEQYRTAQDQFNFGAGTAQRSTARDELLQDRQMPINELMALLGGSQVARPQQLATPTATVQPADLTGLTASNYQAKMQGYTGMLGGLASLGGTLGKAAIGFSDERLKEDISKVGETSEGHNLYSYKYKPETGLGGGLMQLGVMAQEVEKKNPEAVKRDPRSGFRMVDYSKLAA